MDAFFWQQSTGIIQSGIVLMNSLFKSITLFWYRKKHIEESVLDEIWYIDKYLIVNFFSFLIVFGWEKSKMRVIFIHNL